MTKSQNFIPGYDIIMTEDKRKQKPLIRKVKHQ